MFYTNIHVMNEMLIYNILYCEDLMICG